jgi:hypothetical protein
MKTTLYRLIIAGLLPAIMQTVSAQVILTDDFTVSANSNDPNFDITTGRQGGTAAVSDYTAYETPGNLWNHQVGSTTYVGAPDNNHLLLAQNGAVQNNVNLSTATTGPLSVSFNLYNRGSRSGEQPSYWGSFTMQAAGTYPFPVVNSGEFGFLNRENGGIQMFNGGGNIAPAGWDTTGFATNTLWTFIFSDSSGTGSAFVGNGSQVTILNGVYTLGTFTLSQLNTSDIELGFRADSEGNPANLLLIGIDNLSVAPSLPPSWLPIVAQDISSGSSTVAVGSNVVFTAAFSNSPPVSLQWLQIVSGSPNVTNLINTGVVNVTNNGVVSSTLTLNNVAVAGSGSYQLEAVNTTNSAAAVYTSQASLMVVSTITWYPAGEYNGAYLDNTVLALAGPVANEVYGVDFGAGPQTTANGYTFGDVSDTTANNMTVNGAPTSFAGYLPGSATTGDPSLDNILNNGYYGSAANTGTLNNLTVGQTYTVMVLLDDDRTSGAGGGTFDVTDGITVSPAQQYAYPNGTPEVGGYIMGTFTAQATTQPLTVLNNNGNSQYNAVLLMKGVAPQPNNAPTLTKDVQLLSEVATGTSVTLSVGAAGTPPLLYQWSNQNGPISGQTGSNYTFSAVAGINYYSCTISNTVGGVVSSTAEVISSTNIVTVGNFSFEQDVAGGPGQDLNNVHSDWTAFGLNNGDIGSQWVNANSTDFTDPLTAPGSGNQYCFMNLFNQSPRGGIYQDVGPLQANTVYTLTVAIGYRADFVGQGLGSPGIISLVRGTDNTGKVMATGGGLPSSPGWQDYTVSFTNGSAVGDLTIMLSADGNSTTIQSDFDNVRLTKAPFTGTLPAPVLNNPSFEQGTGAVPAYWTPFNDNNFSIVTEAVSSEYASINPLAAPADGTNFFAINEGPSDPTGGIYQEYDALKPNTIYTLTVAVGYRADNGPVAGQWSPGIISLINGDNNNGAVLASTSGIGSVPGAWQDFTVTYTTGASVSGDITAELACAPAGTYQANFDNVRLTLTPAPGVAPAVAAQVSGGNLIITGTGGSPNTGYTVLTTTNLTAPIVWTTNSVSAMDGAGNLSESIPIGAAPATFFRVRVP